MFGKKNKIANVDAQKIAIKLIEEELAVMDELGDGKYQESYIQGMAYMARELGIIGCNESSALTDRAHKKERELAAKTKPIYKKKGCYEYNGYYILKIHDMGDGAANWSIQKIERQEMIETNITFNEAIKTIDKLT